MAGFDIHDRAHGADTHIVSVAGEIDLFSAPAWEDKNSIRRRHDDKILHPKDCREPAVRMD